MAATYEDFASKVEPRSKLAQEVDRMHHGVDKHLVKIARTLSNLEELTDALGLKARHLRDIQAQSNDNPNVRYSGTNETSHCPQ